MRQINVTAEVKGVYAGRQHVDVGRGGGVTKVTSVATVNKVGSAEISRHCTYKHDSNAHKKE